MMPRHGGARRGDGRRASAGPDVCRDYTTSAAGWLAIGNHLAPAEIAGLPAPTTLHGGGAV